MVDFEVDKYYSDGCGNKYKVVDVDNESVTVSVGSGFKKKMKKILYCRSLCSFF